MEIAELEVGQTLKNEEIMSLFKVNRQGGMRRSLEENCLVLTCSHVKKIYDDRWEDGVLYYTGMGLAEGAQKFERQNKTLRDSHFLGIRIYLFEVFAKGEYTYGGEVYLCDAPFIESQYNREEKCSRDVIVFPLKRLGDAEQMAADAERIRLGLEQEFLKGKPLEGLLKLYRAKKPGGSAPRKKKEGIRYSRSSLVKEIALRLSNGACRLCSSDAPFADKHGAPYLEGHHIVPLAKGGSDTVDNVVALCPNCHRKMHILGLEGDRDRLAKKAKEDSDALENMAAEAKN